MSGQRIPRADYTFNNLYKRGRQANLITQAQNIHNSLNGNANFPVLTLPEPLATLQTTIDLYQQALATANKGSKNDTLNKNNARKSLLNLLRVYGIYVTQTAYSTNSLTNNPAFYASMAQIIISSGFDVTFSSSPVANTTGIPIPIQKKAISKSPGTLHFLLKQYQSTVKGVKTWVVNLRTSSSGSTPPGNWVTYTITSHNMTITGLTSGMYDYQIAGQGGHNTKLNQQNPLNFSKIQQIVVT